MMAAEFTAAVNLLPWREDAVRLQRWRLGRGLIFATALGLLLVTVSTWQLKRMRASTDSQVASMQLQMAANAVRTTAAQSTVNEIARWKGFALLAPSARDSYQRVLHLVRDVSAQSVDGLSLVAIEFNGDAIEIKGLTKSKSLAVDYVRGLKARGWPTTSPTVAASDAKQKDFQFLIKPKAKKK